MKYKSKPVEIEAIQWNGAGFSIPMPTWLAEAVAAGNVIRHDGSLHIITLEGTMECSPQDWIICGTEGELYPCKPSVFARKYEPVI